VSHTHVASSTCERYQPALFRSSTRPDLPDIDVPQCYGTRATCVLHNARTLVSNSPLTWTVRASRTAILRRRHVWDHRTPRMRLTSTRRTYGAWKTGAMRSNTRCYTAKWVMRCAGEERRVCDGSWELGLWYSIRSTTRGRVITLQTVCTCVGRQCARGVATSYGLDAQPVAATRRRPKC